ncbi:glycosyltransferase family 4 protein [Paraburkholderia fungorum]|uniref:glycosyltransferase family 4 protein n=1 Tax=Paraburkholderia fungorum TaxID=134537 RepID=UPI00118219AD
MKIGYTKGNYPEQRCVLGKVPDTTYQKIGNPIFIRFLAKIERKLSRKQLSFFDFFHVEKRTPDVDCFHFFNDVSNTRKPWVSTFESMIPRENFYLDAKQSRNADGSLRHSRLVRYKLGLIARDNCKKIIALSQCNMRMQLRMLESYPEFREVIVRKMAVIPPPQALISGCAEKPDDGIVRFTFVGRQFFQKGGYETLEAFARLESEGITGYELTLVGDLSETWNHAHRGVQDKEETLLRAQALISSSQRITHKTKLPNAEVIELLRRTHVGLLPTWADTYGYSVLEFQAAGCPVITTNVRALPEINNGSVGWVVDLPLNESNELDVNNETVKRQLRDAIIDGIYKAARDAIEHPEALRERGQRCIERVASEHSPVAYADQLNRLYAA